MHFESAQYSTTTNCKHMLFAFHFVKNNGGDINGPFRYLKLRYCTL